MKNKTILFEIHQTRVIGFLMTIFLLQFGCSSNLPGDLPKRYPCTFVIVSKETQEPVADVSVSLSPTGDSKWTAGGITNAQGQIVLQTNCMYPGVVPGTYKVLLVKYANSLKYPERAGTEDPGPIVEKPVIPTSFGDPATTSLECVKGTSAETFRFEAPLLP